VLEIEEQHLAAAELLLSGLPFALIGVVNDSGRLTVGGADIDVEIETLRSAWQGTLDW
jgi:hypothetical protein